MPAMNSIGTHRAVVTIKNSVPPAAEPPTAVHPEAAPTMRFTTRKNLPSSAPHARQETWAPAMNSIGTRRAVVTMKNSVPPAAEKRMGLSPVRVG